MHSRIIKRLAQFLIVFSMVSSSYGSNTPDQTVQDLISVVKGPDTYLLVDYVYWPDAFKRLSSSGKKNLRVRSAEEFRAFSYKFLKNPNAVIDSRINEYKLIVPGGGNSPLAEPFDQIGAVFKSKVREAKNNVKSARYEIVNTKINGANAIVIVKSTLRGQSSLNKVNLILVNGRWLLSDVALANNLVSSLKTLPQLPANLGL